VPDGFQKILPQNTKRNVWDLHFPFWSATRRTAISFSHTSLPVMKHGCPVLPQKVSNSPCSGVTNHKKKIKQILSARKIMCTVFWDRYGVLLLDYRPNGQTVNAQVHCNTLQRLRRAIQNKRRGLLSSGVVLLHNNGRPRTAWQTTALLQQFRWDIMDHTPYSPDLAPRDYHLFLTLVVQCVGLLSNTLHHKGHHVHLLHVLLPQHRD